MSIKPTQYKHNFAWGETVGLRRIMMGHILKNGLTFNFPWQDFGYPPHEGDHKLIEATRDLIKNLTGHTYKYVLITSGATHALNAFIAATNTEDKRKLVTHDKYFSFYPGIANNNGLIHIPKKEIVAAKYDEIAIIASPSNPEGYLYGGNNIPTNIVWDAAYYTPAYCGVELNNTCLDIKPSHDAMAGSFSKLTGINGLRVGWLATDNGALYRKALEWTEHDVCGISYPSQHMTYLIVKEVDLDAFYQESRNLIHDNKQELERLSHLFGGQAIQPIGMFALLEADKKLKKLLERASVLIMDGKLCGDHRESVRFNMAKERESTKAMIDAVLKADSIRRR